MTVALLAVGLMGTGGAYTLFTSTASAQTPAASGATVEEGQKLFAANCASCHGVDAEGAEGGPSLIGVSAAAVDFQVGSGRMPPRPLPTKLTQPQIDSLAAYLASLAPASGAPGPAAPDEKYLRGDGNVAVGAELFRINCAMCHNVAGAGGALTEGKAAPVLSGISAERIYKAMANGLQDMPVFNDENITPEGKGDIITYLKFLQENPSPGGFALGSLGPFAEGLFLWIFGLGTVVAFTVWITVRRTDRHPVTTQPKEQNNGQG